MSLAGGTHMLQLHTKMLNKQMDRSAEVREPALHCEHPGESINTVGLIS